MRREVSPIRDAHLPVESTSGRLPSAFVMTAVTEIPDPQTDRQEG